jgi:hypothetical protein
MIATILASLLLTAPADTVRTPPGVAYRIEAILDEEAQRLRGRAELRYTNRSAAALDTLWFHQHLNAFRPGSAWVQRDLQFGLRRFSDLGPADHAFERLLAVEAEGVRVTPVYPFAPDSTVVAIPLPAPLASGASAVIRFDWEARPSTTPRRQGRRGRHYDWAHWYPRIAVRDGERWEVQPLVPQGEFFGEFATYDVTLDVAADQVIGATGVPVEGDPGWGARARSGYDASVYRRDSYEPAPVQALGLLEGPAADGRKRVRWRAEDVHHFAWSANPDFIYEGGTVARAGGGGEPIAIHVLYWPTDADWANGTALGRTVESVEWLQRLFGPYPWPQLTNLHRIEGGGTEFPMMMMNGSPSVGLIMHEAAHQYLHGILANNEFAEGWLDEGFASFVTDWYHEERGVADVWSASMASLIQFERSGRAQPIALRGPEFRDMSTYSAMTYTKASMVFRMLRWMIGVDAMRELMRTLYDRHALGHFTESHLRAAASDVSGQDLDWFFDQWIHTTAQLDYRVTAAEATARPDGRWNVRVEVERAGDAWMPVDLRVGEVELRLNSREPRQVVELVVGERPEVAVLDPSLVLIDLDPSNNRMPVAIR